MEQQSQHLPLLNLSNEQRSVLVEHQSRAIAQMCSVRFSQDKQIDGILVHVYNRGRMDQLNDLLTHDVDQLQVARERIDAEIAKSQEPNQE